MSKKKICAHASKMKGKAKGRNRPILPVSELDNKSIEIGKIVGNLAGTQYIVENIIDQSSCHTYARNNVRAYRLPVATLVAYAITRNSYNNGNIKKTGELIKVISEDEYDELIENFPQITKDMIYLSLNKLNMSNSLLFKSLYDKLEKIPEENNVLEDMSDKEDISDREEISDREDISDKEEISDKEDDMPKNLIKKEKKKKKDIVRKQLQKYYSSVLDDNNELSPVNLQDL
jgi:hypothetical protein